MIKLVRATPADIPFIMATERGPGYELLVGRWPDEEHRAAMVDTNWLYLLGAADGGAPQGFALLFDINNREGSRYLRRIAVVDPGKGFGKPFLSAVIDFVFHQTDTHHLWLSVREANVRARHVYSSFGFVDDGPGTESASRRVSLLKPVWLAR